jgi:5-methylcytosine-specific restriction protein A
MRLQWPALRKFVIERDKVCRECGTPHPAMTQPLGRVRVQWEVDHIVPVADGGTDDPENLRLLCRPCHVRVTTAWRRGRAKEVANV